MNETQTPVVASSPMPSTVSIAPRSSWKKKALIASSIILGTATLAVAGTAWFVKRNVFASAMPPVVLTSAEQSTLNNKLAVLKQSAEAAPAPVDPGLQSRTLTLSEREINAFLEQNGIGEQIKVALNDGGATATMLLPVGENAEVGKGMTLRLSVAIGARMDANKKFTLSIKDVSVAGLSLPNAWLGYIKGLNLFENGNVTDDPAAKAFVDGIRDFTIKAGQLTVILNE